MIQAINATHVVIVVVQWESGLEERFSFYVTDERLAHALCCSLEPSFMAPIKGSRSYAAAKIVNRTWGPL